MKRYHACLLGIFILLFTGCSKEENVSNEKSSISFEILLKDLISDKHNIKQQSSNLPECSEAQPSFVDIVLSRDGEEIRGTTTEPLRLSLASGETLFTQESADLELEPGQYTLDYFKVLDGDENVIWAAPVNNGNSGFADFVDNPLPLQINLGAGVKKYVEVDVLCFEDRFVNQFGYIFFDLSASKAIEFCIFGNYCLENGRHAEAARYKVSVWMYSGDSEAPKGQNLYSDIENGIIVTDYEDYSEISAEPLCLILPDKEGTDEYYFEITILNFDYETEERIIRQGVISDTEVKNLFEGDEAIEYYHFREGNCSMSDSPELFDDSNGNGVDPNLDTDRDGVVDKDDNCPYQYNPDQNRVDYYGSTCFEPCEINTDDEIHKPIGIQSENNGSDELFEFSTSNGFVASLTFLDKPVDVGILDGSFSEPGILRINVFIDAGRYLEDHVIEIRDDLNGESYCKIIHPAQIVPGTGNDSYSQFEIEIPDDLSPPYYIRFKGNLFEDL